jgi:hypothetical protein
VTPGPDGRQCTPYLPAGPGGTPLDLPLSDGLGGALSRATTAGRPDALRSERTAKKRAGHFGCLVLPRGSSLPLPGLAEDCSTPMPTVPEEPIRLWQSTTVPPNVGAKGEADGGMTGPDGRQCTPYLPAGPGSTPLDLPLSDGLGGARLRTTIARRPDALSAERTAKKREEYLAVWLCLEAPAAA